MGNFGKSAKGGPFAKLSILAIFLAQLRQAIKSSILVRFEPNQYGQMRNLFQFLMIPKTLSNNKNQLRNRNISKGYSKWAILAKVQRGDPLQNSRFWPFSWPRLRYARKQAILVRFEPNQYGWMRNLFYILMIPKTLSNNKNQLRNRNISKGYSKWAILAKVQRRDPLQNSRFLPFSWPNFVRLENRQYQCDLSLISKDGCGDLFQFLMIPKTLSSNKNQLRNRNISKGYSKWAILAKVQRGDPLQNSRFWPFSWPNFVRL